MTRSTPIAPRVSVVMPAYNAKRYVRAAIASVLAQTMRDFELIVVDDGSTDGTAAIVKRATDPRVRYVYQENAERSAARNRGVDLAPGEYLSFLDADDLYDPCKMALQVSFLDANPEVGLVAGGYHVVDAHSAVLETRRPWLTNPTLDLDAWLRGCPVWLLQVTMRRGWFYKVGGFDLDMSHAEDHDFFLRLAAAGCPMAWQEEIVASYRVHERNTTRQTASMTAGQLRAAQKYFDGLPPGIGNHATRDRVMAGLLLKGARRSVAAGDRMAANRYILEARCLLLRSLTRDLRDAASSVLGAIHRRLFDMLVRFYTVLGWTTGEYLDLFVLRRLEWQFVRRELTLSGGETVCDVACGYGNWARRMSADGARVTALDLDPERAWRAARDRSGLARGEAGPDLVAADAEALPLVDKCYDRVVSICSLEHFEDDRLALREMARVLRPGGRLILTVDSLSSPDGPRGELAEWLRRRYVIRRTYRISDLTERLEAVGLSVEQSEYVGRSRWVNWLYRQWARAVRKGGQPRMQRVLFPLIFATAVVAERGARSANGGAVVAVAARKPGDPTEILRTPDQSCRSPVTVGSSVHSA